MVLTDEQRLRGLALGESEADVGFNFAQRALSLEQTHAALVDAGLEGCSVRSLDLKSFNPRFLVDVARGTPLRDGWGIHQLSVVSPGDAMGNRVGDGVNATEREDPQVVEVATVGADGKLTKVHPATDGDQIQRFPSDDPTHAIEWIGRLLREPTPKPDAARVKVIEALKPDASGALPFGWGDVLLVDGLVHRTDLNRRLAEAHGRVKRGETPAREGITMLLDGEEVWARRANLRLVVPTAGSTRDLERRVARLRAECDAHGVADAEVERAVRLLNGERTVHSPAAS